MEQLSVAGIKQCVAHTMWRCKYLLNTNCYHINLGKRQWNIDGFWRFVWKWKMEFLINSVIQCKSTGSESIKIYSKMFYRVLYSIELCLSQKKVTFQRNVALFEHLVCCSPNVTFFHSKSKYDLKIFWWSFHFLLFLWTLKKSLFTSLFELWNTINNAIAIYWYFLLTRVLFTFEFFSFIK